MDLLGHYLQDRQQKIRKTTDGIRSEIYEQLDCGEEISDERLGQIIDEKIRQKQDIQLALEERESIHREIFAAIPWTGCITGTFGRRFHYRDYGQRNAGYFSGTLRQTGTVQ